MQLRETINKLARKYGVGTTLEEIYSGAVTLLKGMQLLPQQPALAGIDGNVYLISTNGSKDRKVSNPSQNLGSDITDTVTSNESEPRSFEERARDFLGDINNGEGFTTVYREVGHDVAGLKVGIGKHIGLVFKEGQVSHAQKASEFYDRLVGHFKEGGYEPWSYELVKPNFVAVGKQVGVVQEYFKQPSLSELFSYLMMRKEIEKRERKLGRPLNPEEMSGFVGRFVMNQDSRLRCEQFLNEQHNRDITLEQIIDVRREFKDGTDYLGLWIKLDNIIVLGRRKVEDLQKIGLAIIDY